MSNFADFNDTDGNHIAINPLLVRAVSPVPDAENACLIHFDGQHSVSVRGTPAEIIREIKDAITRYR